MKWIPFAIIIISLVSIMHVVSAQNEFLESFDFLSTIAGKGNFDDKGYNGWSSTFENGMATNAELSRPHIAMADAEGNIYIADKDAHAIRIITTEGVISTYAGNSVAGDGENGLASTCQLNAPNGLWVSASGVCYILDLNNNKIKKVDNEGYLTTLFTDESGISLGRGLWLNQTEDTVWYCNSSQIKLWTAQNGVEIHSDGYQGLGNIVQDQHGNIMATDRIASKVYRINKAGEKTLIAGNGSGTGVDGIPAIDNYFDEVRGVWCMPDGSYFLATHAGSQVWYIDADGISHLFLNGKKGDEYHGGDDDNYRIAGYKISEARAVTVDYQGNVIITENDRGFIRKVSKKGTSNRLLTSTNNQVSIYPNPIENSFEIKNYPQNGSWQIYSLQATLIKRGKSITVNCNHLKQGAYILQVGSERIKFLKQ